MSRYPFPVVILLTAVLSLGLLTLDTEIAAAQSEDEEEIDYSALKTRRTPVLGNKVYEKLAEAQELVDTAKDFNGARQVLSKMLDSYERGRLKLNAYELANVWNTMGFLDYSQERYRSAVRSYRRVISDPEQIPLPLLTSTLYTLAQLSFVLERYSAAIRYLRQWLRLNEDPAPDAWFLLSQAYFQNGNNSRALANALKGKATAAQKGIAMRENWWLLLRVLYYDKKDYPNVIKVLQELVTGWPKKTYWVQLSGMYGHLDNEKHQRSSLHLARMQNLLTKDKELVGLASLLIAAEAPYLGAKILAQGIEEEIVEASSRNLELLGSAWQQAKELERALPVLERAAKISEKGEIYFRLASVYMDLDRFKKAAEAARKGLKKGNLRRPDTLNIILGMSLFNIKQYDNAKKAFDSAEEDERSKSLASQWKDYIDQQVERQRLLEQDLSDSEILQLLKGA